MNRIHSIGFEFVGKLGKNPDTGRMRLMPFALMSLVINTGTQPDLIVVEATETELRKLAEDLLMGADELKNRVDPLCSRDFEIDHEEALNMARDARAILTATSAPTIKHNQAESDIRELAAAGWNYDDLLVQLDAMTAGEDHPPECGCQTDAPVYRNAGGDVIGENEEVAGPSPTEQPPDPPIEQTGNA